MLGLFLDLSETFQGILCHKSFYAHKLEYCPIRGHALDWFKICLTNHVKYTVYNNTISTGMDVCCGVSPRDLSWDAYFL